MDPKLSQLDPKLKEAYDRVLTGQNAQSAQTPAPLQNPVPQQPTPNAQAQPQPQTIIQPTPTTSQPIQPQAQPQPNVNPIMPTPQATNINGAVSFNAAASTETVVKKGKPNIKNLLLGLGVVVFLVAYTFLWIFIFKIKLPFLPA